MSKNSIIEMIIFITFAFGSSYIFDIGLWGFLVGILAAALFKTVKKSEDPSCSFNLKRRLAFTIL